MIIIIIKNVEQYFHKELEFYANEQSDLETLFILLKYYVVKWFNFAEYFLHISLKIVKTIVPVKYCYILDPFVFSSYVFRSLHKILLKQLKRTECLKC